MARKILEDMRVNRKENKLPSMKEVVLPSKPIVPVIDYKEIQREKELERERERSKKEAEKEEEKRDKEIEKKNESKIDEYFKNKAKEEQRLERTPQIKRKPKIVHKFTVFVFVLAVIAGGIYWGGNIFQKADVTVTSKHKAITYNNKQFVASKDSSSDAVNFEIMITPDKDTRNIILTQTKEVSIKSTGSITLYNEFSMNPVQLTAGTFISDDNGKAYKIDKTISIPGYKLDTKKKIIAGKIISNITAFLPGEAYNGSPTDFHITSYKGTAKYDKIYGKLNNPLVGGASGLVYVLDDASKKKIDSLAQIAFKESLIRQVDALVPNGYILYPGATVFSYKVDDNFISKTPQAVIPIEGSLSVVLLKEKNLMDNIIKNSLPGITGSELNEIAISDLSKLTFSFTDKNQLITKEINSISFSLSGNVDAVWHPDENVLKTKLLGVKNDNVLSIFRKDPGIASALVKIFPPWQKYIPDDISKVNIIMK